MRTRRIRELPGRMERLRKRFERWRQTRKPRTRIPDSLWAAAVEIARTYGLARTARAIRLEYYSLKKRLEQRSTAAGRHEPSAEPTFVELPPMPTSVCELTLELEDMTRSKMRIHLKTATPPDLAALCRSFWNPAS